MPRKDKPAPDKDVIELRPGGEGIIAEATFKPPLDKEEIGVVALSGWMLDLEEGEEGLLAVKYESPLPNLGESEDEVIVGLLESYTEITRELNRKPIIPKGWLSKLEEARAAQENSEAA